MKKLTILLICAACIFTACKSSPKPYVFAPAIDSPHELISEIEIQFDRLFPLTGIQKLPVKVYYYPEDDAVCLEYRITTYTYHLFWSYDGRRKFLSSLENYKKDFESRSFGRSSRTTKKKYGSETGYLHWRMTSITRRSYGEVPLEFGYAFINSNPYFIITQVETAFFDPLYQRDDDERRSRRVEMYFTRAQADELAALFNQEFLDSIIIGASAINPGGGTGSQNQPAYNEVEF